MDSFTDPRDGQVYKVTTIKDPLLPDGIIIMAENLNFKPYGNDSCGIPDAVVYDGNEQYREKLGLLYNFYGASFACPKGWRLPKETEWKRIFELVRADIDEEFIDKAKQKYSIPSLVDKEIQYEVARRIKSTTGWLKANGTNSSGLNLTPGGYAFHTLTKTPRFYDLGKEGEWWSSSYSSDSSAVTVFSIFDGDFAFIQEFKKDQLHYASCRCIKVSEKKKSEEEKKLQEKKEPEEKKKNKQSREKVAGLMPRPKEIIYQYYLSMLG